MNTVYSPLAYYLSKVSHKVKRSRVREEALLGEIFCWSQDHCRCLNNNPERTYMPCLLEGVLDDCSEWLQDYGIVEARFFEARRKFKTMQTLSMTSFNYWRGGRDRETGYGPWIETQLTLQHPRETWHSRLCFARLPFCRLLGRLDLEFFRWELGHHSWMLLEDRRGRRTDRWEYKSRQMTVRRETTWELLEKSSMLWNGTNFFSSGG